MVKQSSVLCIGSRKWQASFPERYLCPWSQLLMLQWNQAFPRAPETEGRSCMPKPLPTAERQCLLVLSCLLLSSQIHSSGKGPTRTMCWDPPGQGQTTDHWPQRPTACRQRCPCPTWHDLQVRCSPSKGLLQSSEGLCTSISVKTTSNK